MPKSNVLPKSPKLHHVHPALLARARDFRHPLTPPEAKVWAAVRDRKLGFKFRRQHPIGRFITDFYCVEAKLAIEIDGDTHSAPDQAAYDAARTAWLAERGYAVIRFDAREVGRNLAGVVDAIRAACEARAQSLQSGSGL